MGPPKLIVIVPCSEVIYCLMLKCNFNRSALSVTHQCYNQAFANCQKTRNGEDNFSPRSWDLTTLGYFWCKLIKEMYNTNYPEVIHDLKREIEVPITAEADHSNGNGSKIGSAYRTELAATLWMRLFSIISRHANEFYQGQNQCEIFICFLVY